LKSKTIIFDYWIFKPFCKKSNNKGKAIPNIAFLKTVAIPQYPVLPVLLWHAGTASY
jgi:hypothetical protein